MTNPFPVVDLVSVRRSVSPDAIQLAGAKAVRMTIVGENVGAVPIDVPYAPLEVDHSDLGGAYNYINRPGLPDATIFDAAKVPKMSFSLLVTDKLTAVATGIQTFAPIVTTAISVIQTLSKYSREGTRVRITYGVLESGLWYIDSMSVSSITRDPRSDEITQATVDLSLTRASDITDGVGPLTGGVKPATPPPAPAPPQQTSSRYYTVVRGDTLWAISIKFYGTGTKWTTIADANGVKDPRLLQIGTVLRIP